MVRRELNKKINYKYSPNYILYSNIILGKVS